MQIFTLKRAFIRLFPRFSVMASHSVDTISLTTTRRFQKKKVKDTDGDCDMAMEIEVRRHST